MSDNKSNKKQIITHLDDISEQEKLVLRELTNKEIAQQTKMEVDAHVSRESYSNPMAEICQRKVRECGENLQPNKEAEYLGSFVVHAYRLVATEQLVNITQIANGDHEPTLIEARKAVSELMHQVAKTWGMKPQTKRSGL